MDLQDRATRWHEERFPRAELEHVGLKVLAEAGELADAILAARGKNSATGKRGDGIVGEAADIVICLLVIAGRWGCHDLLSAVDMKLSILETPGAHPASLLQESS